MINGANLSSINCTTMCTVNCVQFSMYSVNCTVQCVQCSSHCIPVSSTPETRIADPGGCRKTVQCCAVQLRQLDHQARPQFRQLAI